MTQAAASSNVAPLRMPNIAPLRNVMLLRAMFEQLRARTANLPGIGVFYGEPGLGKSNACAAINRPSVSVYVELRDHFTRKSFLEAILHELGIKPERTAAMMFDQVCAQLSRSAQLLILDMADYLVKRHMVDTLLDLYEGSNAPIVLVGEEHFPRKLEMASGRFYDRVLLWRLAEFCDLQDTRKLANLYSPDVDIKDDLLAHVRERNAGVARKIVVDVNGVRGEAKKLGLRAVDLKAWGERPFFTSEPERRKAAPARRAP